MKPECAPEPGGVTCHRCGRRVESVRLSSRRPRDHRHGHEGPICARCWLQENLTALRLGPSPVPAPGAPKSGAYVTAREARERWGVPIEALYAGEALGLIHPVRTGRPAGRVRRREISGGKVVAAVRNTMWNPTSYDVSLICVRCGHHRNAHLVQCLRLECACPRFLGSNTKLHG